MLHFNFEPIDEEIESQNDVVRWFNSSCESVTSKSLVVEVYGLSKEVEICAKIQDTLLALHKRIKTFSVYLTPGMKAQALFSKLYEAEIVIEDYIGLATDKAVGYCILTSYL